MSYYFLSQRYERKIVINKKVENDFKHASSRAIQATHLDQ